MSPIKIRSFTQIFLQGKSQKILDSYFCLLLLIPLLFIAYPLAEPGISITGDFPYLDTPDYAINRLWVWIEKGSVDGFEFMSRFPIIGLWELLGFINVNSELATKAMILLGFSLSSFSFYFSFLSFFKERFTGSKMVLKTSAIMGSLFYAYNVWSFNRIHHWYLWIGYSILPLFFISIFFSFKNPKDWKYILSSIFLWSLASTTPHMTLFYGIILVGTFLGFIFNNLKKSKKLTIQLGIPLLLIISFYSMVNMYWIYPYILASQTQVLIPNYELTEENLELLSRESNFLNALRVMAYWLNSDVEISEHLLLYYLGIFASFAVPAIAFSSLFLKRSIKFSLIFSSSALIGIILAMGTQSPFDYYKLMLSTPILSEVAWIFRDSDKWSFLIAFGYSFLVGIVSYHVLSFATKGKNKDKKNLLIATSFTLLLIGSIFLSSYAFYYVRMEPLKPVILPTEFDKLNEYLSTINNDKIFFMPYPSYETQWQMNGRVGSIYQMHSIKPSIESTEYNLMARNYYNFLVNSIIENRSKNIGNLIYPLGTSYIIFHNDTWSKKTDSYDQDNIDLLKKLYYLEDLRNIENIGFYKIFKISNDNNNSDTVREVNIPSQNIAVLSGLDIFDSLNTLSSFNSLHSSLFFLDDIRTKDTNTFMKSLNELILARQPSDDEFALSYVGDKYIIAPFDTTYRNDPSDVWSKSRARDPTHAEFHPDLRNLGINNWNLDYGKGLVMTKAMGAKLSVPVEIETQNKKKDGNDNNFYLFVRYLKNQKGGQIKIYLDNKLINKVDTLDKISNNFVWEKVNASINLSKGTHLLTLENVAGLNAVNIFALIPHEEMNRLRTQTTRLLEDKIRIIYLLEAESNFYNNKGVDIGSFNLFFGNDSSIIDNNYRNNAYTETFKGQFKVPTNSDLVALHFLAKKNPAVESSYSIKDLEVAPAYKKYNVFRSDFESKGGSVPLATLRHSDWMNYDKDLISTFLETSRTIYGNNSLRVDLKQGDKAGWNILSTDLIPIDDDAYYNATLDISAKDVEQLHSRILYYDLNEKEMTGATDYVFKGKDGTFKDTFTSSILPPMGAKYLKYQVLTLSDNPKPSSYLLDNVKLDEIMDYNTAYNNLDSLDDGQNMINLKKKDYMNTELKNNSTDYLIQTKPFAVKENHTYNYTITAKAKNVLSYSAIASFKNSGDVSKNSTRYGTNASNGNVLSLSNGSEIHAKLDVIKPSNYTIALRAKTCETCTFLSLSIEGYDSDKKAKGNIQANTISLKDKASELKWVHSNSTYHLNKGTYELKIYSDSQTDLDSVMIYSVGNVNSSSDTNKEYDESFHDPFRQGENSSLPVEISGYKKINPTKYILDIKNATRPFMVSFAESYDPLWIAYSDTTKSNTSEVSKENNNFKINSIPLYGVTNGFFVNKTGDYSLLIEYEPQKWFTNGAIISIATLATILISIFLFRERKITKFYAAITKRIQKYHADKK